MTDWLKILYDERRIWPGEFFDVLSLEKSLHYGPKFNFLWKILISDFHEIAILSIWTLYGFVVHKTWPFRNHQKVHGVSLHLGDFGTFPELPRFRYSDRNFLIHVTNLHIKSHNWPANQNLIPCWLDFQLEMWLVDSLIPKSRT